MLSGDPFFYGLESRWFSGDRLYRIYPSRRMLAGAYVAGQFYDRRTTTRQLRQLATILWPLVDRAMRRREQREQLYDGCDPFGPAFLGMDTRNFQIERALIRGARLNRSRSWRAYENCGTLTLRLADGTTRAFILVSELDVESVLAKLSATQLSEEVVGRASPVPPRHDPARDRRRARLFAGSLMLVLAVFIMVSVALKMGPGPGRIQPPPWLIAAACAACGVWFLVQGMRTPVADAPRRTQGVDSTPPRATEGSSWSRGSSTGSKAHPSSDAEVDQLP